MSGPATNTILPVANAQGASGTGSVRQISDGNPNGTTLGQSPSDLISFFGAAPIVQPGGAGPNRGVVGNITSYTSTQSPSAVTTITSAEKTMTVSGVLATDLVLFSKPTSQAGLAVGTGRASAADTVRVTLANLTGSTITPTASESWNVTTIPAALTQSAVLTPQAVAANTTVEQQFAVSGSGAVAAGMFLAVNKPTSQTGLIILGARVIGANLIGITFANVTAAPITPTAGETYIYYAGFGMNVAPVMTEMTAALNPASVAANTTAEQTFTVAGLAAGTFVQVDPPAPTPGLGIAGVRVSAANTLAINFSNTTGSAIDPPLGNYVVSYFATQNPAAGSSTAVSSTTGTNAGAALVALGLTAS